MAKKKLTAAERLLDEQLLAMLEWASDNPTKWPPDWQARCDAESSRAAGEARRDRDLAGNSALQAQAERVDNRARYSALAERAASAALYRWSKNERNEAGRRACPRSGVTASD
jgi:hypothetical protein